MFRTIPRTLPNSIALIIIAGALGAWLGMLMFRPADDADGHAGGHVATARQQPDSAAHATDGHQMSMSGPLVAERISANPETLSFCVSSSLEPFDGAIAQIRAAGPAEASRRLRDCVGAMLVGHASAEMTADLDSHLPHFQACLQFLERGALPAKPEVVERVAECVSPA